MFIKVLEEIYHVLRQESDGCWVIRFENPQRPQFLSAAQMEVCQRVPAPKRYLQSTDLKRKLTESERKKLAMLQPMIDEPLCISDFKRRKEWSEKIAERHHTTPRRIYQLYLLYLAQDSLMPKPRESHLGKQTKIQRTFQQAIETLYYSAKRPSLRSVYDCMLLEHFTDDNGKLLEGHPTWHSFRQYYYSRGLHKGSQKQISREGLTNYQRNHRMLFGNAQNWKSQIGCYQMDATQGDLYLVSSLDPNTVIGRPNLYLAVDTVTGLIAGFYAGMETGEQAVLYCLANTAQDKVAFCAKYGITITAEQWPSAGLPGEIITDRGREFCGSRIDVLCKRYGIERESLPPFRPDQKGLVEKNFGLIQNSYTSALRGKGMIEPDAQERWATDYRKQASLTLNDYIKLLIHTIVYLNSARVLRNYPLSDEMLRDHVTPTASGLWNWFAEMGRSTLLELDPQEYELLALSQGEATVDRHGVRFRGFHYGAKEYRSLLEKLMRRKVTVAYDPERTDLLYLVQDDEYVRLPLTKACSRYRNQSYAEAQQHRAAEQDAKQQYSAAETQARVDLTRQIQTITSTSKR